MAKLTQALVCLSVLVLANALTTNRGEYGEYSPFLEGTAGYIHTRELQQVPGDQFFGCKDQMARCIMECREPSWCSCDRCPDMRDQWCHTCHVVIDDPAKNLYETLNRYNKFVIVANETEKDEAKRAKVLKAAQLLLLPATDNSTGGGKTSPVYMDQLFRSIEETKGEMGDIKVYSTVKPGASAWSPPVEEPQNDVFKKAAINIENGPTVHTQVAPVEAHTPIYQSDNQTTGTNQSAISDGQVPQLSQEVEEHDPIRKAAMRMIKSIG